MSNNKLRDLLNKHAQEFKAGHLDRLEQEINRIMAKGRLEAQRDLIRQIKDSDVQLNINTRDLLSHISHVINKRLHTLQEEKSDE